MRPKFSALWQSLSAPRPSGPRRTLASTSRTSARGHFQPLEERLALATLPAGFSEVTLTSGLANPTAMEFSPTGELWVLEQSGDVRLVRSNGTTHEAIDLAVNSVGERGLLGLTFDSDYDGTGPNTDYIYLYYTDPAGPAADEVNNRLSRFVVTGAGTDTPSLGSEVILRDLPPEGEDGDSNHNGGAIHFGPDGKLYVAVGDHNVDGSPSQAQHPSQRLDTPFGKMLRLNADGTNPDDNPHYTGSASDWQGSIWARGLRNPFTFSFDPGSGRMFINDVGEGGWEEINEGEFDANYGWASNPGPVWEGFENDGTPPPWANYRDPVMAYDHSNSPPTPAAVAITGGVFYPSNSQFGSDFDGVYFFADFGANFIRIFDPDNPGSLAVPDTSTGFATNANGTVDLDVDADGNLYYLSRSGGVIRRVSFDGDFGPAQVEARHVFYNNSGFDNNEPQAGAADDAAIATDKTAYLVEDGIAQPAHATSYAKGINGIIVDISGNHGPLSVDDFTFRVSETGTNANNVPDSWLAAPAPSDFLVRPAAGTGGADRVHIVWPDGAIANRWLEVTVEGDDSAGNFNTNTGLDESDVFYFGNVVGDTFDNSPPEVFVTTSSDEIAIQAEIVSLADVTSPLDMDRNGVHLASDRIVTRSNTVFALNRIELSNVPAAPVAGSANDGAASAVAAGLSISSAVRSATSAWPESGELSVAAAPTAPGITAAPQPAPREAADPRDHAFLTLGEEAGDGSAALDELIESLLADG